MTTTTERQAMTKVNRSAVGDALFSVGLDDDALYADYSGRGMYGDKCLGVVTDGPGDASAFLVELGGYLEAHGEDPDVARAMAQASQTDGMGLKMITYWPGFQVE